MSKISISLWYDKEAKEAAKLYASTFPNTKITSSNVMEDTPSGSVDIVSMEIMGRNFTLMSAGPYFIKNPSISFHIPCRLKEDVEKIWAQLLPGGKVLMEPAEYPFSPWYGWIQDKYGVSWQLIVVPPEQKELTLTPVLMFTKTMVGKAEEAANFYTKTFKSPAPQVMMRYTKGQEPDKEGNVAYGEFVIDQARFGFMESSREHEFSFNEAISFIVNCKNQEEIDYYFEKLSAVPESEQCGWLKDKYGVSWQIIPENLGELLNSPEKTQKFMKMKKVVINELK